LGKEYNDWEKGDRRIAWKEELRRFECFGSANQKRDSLLNERGSSFGPENTGGTSGYGKKITPLKHETKKAIQRFTSSDSISK